MTAKPHHMLAFPIEVDGADLTSITLRRPKGHDLRAVSGLSPLDGTLLMIERLGGLPKGAAEELDALDIAALEKTINAMVAPGGAGNG